MKYRLSLACMCIALCTACNQVSDQEGFNQANEAPSVSTPQNETRLVSLKVEGMTCPTGCYPTVRSAIAKQSGVLDVELAPQKVEDVIDNPVVFVKYKGDLDLDKMFKAIERAGFEARKLSN